MSVSKITIGRPTRTYTHNMSAKSYGTTSFGKVSNLYTLNVQPNDYVDINMRQVLRLAPMPVPTFGTIRSVNVPAFVSIRSVFPLYEQFLAGQPVQRQTAAGHVVMSTIDALPWCTNSQLLSRCLRGALCCYAEPLKVASPDFSDLESKKYDYHWWFDGAWRNKTGELLESISDKLDSLAGFTDDTAGSLVLGLGDLELQNIQDGTVNLSDFGLIREDLPKVENEDVFNQLFDVGYLKYVADHPLVNVDNADVILSAGPAGGLLCFKLSLYGKKLYSLLRSLGYSLDMCDYSKLSVLPMMAWYRGYFDMFHPKRHVNWEMTYASTIVSAFQNNKYSFEKLSVFHKLDQEAGDEYNLANLFDKFLRSELAMVEATVSPDFYGAHLSADDLKSDVSVSGSSLGSGGPVVVGRTGVTRFGGDGSVSLGNIEFARRVGRFIAKETVLGRAISDLLKAHFNVGSEERYDVRSLGILAYGAEVSDVVSQSDTVTKDGGAGEALGAYAGRGIGHDNGTFRFEAPDFGIIFVYSFVVPDMEYLQGNDPTLGAVTRFDIPTPEFDGLGYEVTPFSTVYDGRGVSNIDRAEYLHGGFGFIPRYSGFKTKKNTVYGDFAVRGFRSLYDAYHTDRVLRFDDYYSLGSKSVAVVRSKLPAASDAWRYVTSDKMGDFNRIFFSHNFLDPNVVDCMIQQTVFDVKLRNKFKPISQSFETYNDGDEALTVSRE